MVINKKVLASIFVISLLALGLGYGTYAYFSDTETSSGNVVTAGTLDLQIDDTDTNIVKVNIQNWKPSSGPYLYTYKLTNVGTLKGYLNLCNINVTDYENGLIDPEVEAGDTTEDVGELSSLIKVHLFIDNTPSNGWFGAEDVTIYSGYLQNIGSDYNIDLPMASGETTYITIQIGWWLGGNDNLAQSDSAVFDIGFRLDQA